MSFITLSQLSVLVPLLFGLLYYSRSTPTFRLLLLFFLFSAVVECSAYYFSAKYGNNMPLLHVFTCVEVCVYSYAYARIFDKNLLFKTLCFTVLFLQFFVSINDAFLISGLFKFPTFARSWGAGCLILLSLYQLYLIFKTSNDLNLLNKPSFWLLFGVLTYFSSIIFFILMVNITISTDKEAFKFIHNFHAGINIICNFIFGYSFLCFRFKQD